MSVAVGVCELGGFAQHGCAEDVDPGDQGHAEGRGHKVQLVDEVRDGLEMCVPRDVGQIVVWASH